MACLEGDDLNDVVYRRIVKLRLIPAADGLDAVQIQFFLDAVAMVTVVLVQSQVLRLQLLDSRS